MNTNEKPIDNTKLNENLSKIKHKIAVMSGKGGVGKSMVSVNLAFDLAMRGANVGLLDADIHGPSTLKMLDLEEGEVKGDEKGIFPMEATPHLKVISMGMFLADRDTPVIWRGPMKMGAIRQFLEEVYWGELDYLIIDLPPGTGDEPLSIAQLIPDIDGAVVVTTPQDVALLDSRKAVGFAVAIKMHVVGIIENMSGFVCPNCGESIDLFKTGGGEQTANELGIPFLGKIPIDPQIVLNCDNGKPFILANPKSEAAIIFKDIVTKIENSVTNSK
ncbi:MAG: antiporter inner membrane protein [ANME-2 cluster archaeon HR1]|nr:MAG: Chromosome partitioning ATPase, Mrp family, contains Fe-S cluster [ANME-2 cluster archaeon]KAF5429238.1 Chromosome partitioning ATPase, Mrp family, contains Fe-S cluster [ANME-2 cluster archaeon]PPA80374.1 MAG: antiporter inner membrane protein [ANME-2 cluster archaeon HR1]